MLSINTNLSSLITQSSMNSATNKLNQAIERMTTGYKINNAKDNAAGYSISTNMTTKIGAYDVAEDNAAMGFDMISTATESLSLIENKLIRLRDLAIQASSGTYGADSLKAINTEANALVDEIERQYNTTEYNGINLAKGKVAGTEESKFIKDIDRRDTSKMITLASVDVTQNLEYGTYSISTVDELVKLATMTNNALIGAATEFVLANDIDLGHITNWIPIGQLCTDTDGKLIEELTFRAKFDGNGFIISGLNINNTTLDSPCGLFGMACSNSIINVGLEDVNIISNYGQNGGILGRGNRVNIENCYIEGDISGKNFNAGGLVGFLNIGNVDSCYSSCNIAGNYYVGGLVGAIYNGSVANSFVAGSVTSSKDSAGGFIGYAYSGTIRLQNCYTNVTMNVTATYASSFIGLVGMDAVAKPHTKLIIDNCFVEEYSDKVGATYLGILSANSTLILKNSSYNEQFDTLGTSPIKLANTSDISITNLESFASETPYEITNDATIFLRDKNIGLQVGVNNNESSKIGVEVGYDLYGVLSLRNIGNNNVNYLSQIDLLLNQVSVKQTGYGAVLNRLESVLEEITIQRDNLVSSRSTIRDADIAQESSKYIQAQILQQASATLLATANQSPAIALQLI